MRHWLLTWTTYGSWLPGDDRGSITSIRINRAGKRIHYNFPGTPVVGALPELRSAAGAKIEYVRNQAHPLLIWSADAGTRMGEPTARGALKNSPIRDSRVSHRRLTQSARRGGEFAPWRAGVAPSPSAAHRKPQHGEPTA